MYYSCWKIYRFTRIARFLVFFFSHFCRWCRTGTCAGVCHLVKGSVLNSALFLLAWTFLRPSLYPLFMWTAVDRQLSARPLIRSALLVHWASCTPALATGSRSSSRISQECSASPPLALCCRQIYIQLCSSLSWCSRPPMRRA